MSLHEEVDANFNEADEHTRFQHYPTDLALGRLIAHQPQLRTPVKSVLSGERQRAHPREGSIKIETICVIIGAFPFTALGHPIYAPIRSCHASSLVTCRNCHTGRPPLCEDVTVMV